MKSRKLGVDFIRTVLPVLLALFSGGLLLLILGKNPINFYSDIWRFGIAKKSWQDSATMFAPILLVAVGLIVVFRANLWNLGYDGQYLIGAALISGFSPYLTQHMSVWLAWFLLSIMAAAAGAAVTIIPAWLKAKFGTNEIITSLMMSFITIGFANILIKGPFQDPNIVVPQTKVLPLNHMLPHIPGTRISIGLIVALAMAFGVHYLLSRTSFGLKLDIYGASSKSAQHAGISVPKMVFTLFLISGALIGLASSVDILGHWGYVRTNWNPSYGNAILPFVFLGRLNVLASLPFVMFYSVLATGGAISTQRSGLSSDFLLVIVALILLFMTVIEYIGTKQDLGQSYIPSGLKRFLKFSKSEGDLG